MLRYEPRTLPLSAQHSRRNQWIDIGSALHLYCVPPPVFLRLVPIQCTSPALPHFVGIITLHFARTTIQGRGCDALPSRASAGTRSAGGPTGFPRRNPRGLAAFRPYPDTTFPRAFVLLAGCCMYRRGSASLWDSPNHRPRTPSQGNPANVKNWGTKKSGATPW